MTMNRRERKTVMDLIEALHDARAFFEPGPSWNQEERRFKAMQSIRRTVGCSDPRFSDAYEKQPERG